MGIRDFVFCGITIVGLLLLTASLWGTAADQAARNSKSESRRIAETDRQQIRATAQHIDKVFQADWKQLGEHAAPAPNLTVVRRLSLALTGTLPSLEEIRMLETIESEQQIEWWLDHLLGDRRSADYLAERLGRTFVGTDNGPFLLFRRRRFVLWLSDQISKDRPYDDLVRELIGQRGLWTQKPAVNFLTATLDVNAEDSPPDPVRLAGRVSRAFLGMRIDCLECHDDQLGTVMLGDDEPRTGEQQDFHHLAAFFGQTRTSPFGIRDQAKTEQDEPIEYRYKYLHADKEAVVAPQVPFQAELLPKEGNRRQRLASWVTHPENRAFSRAAVNRVWAILFGRPLHEPVDDIPLHKELPVLDSLAADFEANGYRLHRLIRAIAATQAFRIDGRADFDVTERHEQAWAVFPLSRLRPEQMAGGILQACALETIDAKTNILFRIMRFARENDFIRRYGDKGEEEFTERGGTITQRLLMMNGDLIKELTKVDLLANAATQIGTVTNDNTKAIEAAYLATLTRYPTPRELQHFTQRLADENQQRTLTMEDIFWVLLNSSEFSWNH